MSRKRKHIPLEQRLAAALACLLPQEIRDMFREASVSAKSVINQFTFDHIKLHSFGGSDKWWNLHPARRGPELKAKDNADTSRAAKARRIDKKWTDFMRDVAAGRKPRPSNKRGKPWPKTKWPKRKMRGGGIGSGRMHRR